LSPTNFGGRNRKIRYGHRVPISISRPMQQTARRSDSGWPRKRRFFVFGRFCTFPKVRLSNGRNSFTTANIEMPFGGIVGDRRDAPSGRRSTTYSPDVSEPEAKNLEKCDFFHFGPPWKIFRWGIGPVETRFVSGRRPPSNGAIGLEEMSTNKGT
jgi:hypothetical protein